MLVLSFASKLLITNLVASLATKTVNFRRKGEGFRQKQLREGTKKMRDEV